MTFLQERPSGYMQLNLILNLHTQEGPDQQPLTVLSFCRLFDSKISSQASSTMDANVGCGCPSTLGLIKRGVRHASMTCEEAFKCGRLVSPNCEVAAQT